MAVLLSHDLKYVAKRLRFLGEQGAMQPGVVTGMYYYKTSVQMFGGFYCGVKTRFSADGMDFDAIYLKNPNTMETAIRTPWGPFMGRHGNLCWSFSTAIEN